MGTSRGNLRREVERFLKQKIPLTRAMGVKVVKISPLTIEAPVKRNLNHLRTAFGGSINAVATLAAYAFLWLQLRNDPSTHVVVAESSIRFRRPVRRTIRAVCLPLRKTELATLEATLAATGRARIRLRVAIEENRATAAEFEGQFVAIRLNGR